MIYPNRNTRQMRRLYGAYKNSPTVAAAFTLDSYVSALREAVRKAGYPTSVAKVPDHHTRRNLERRVGHLVVPKGLPGCRTDRAPGDALCAAARGIDALEPMKGWPRCRACLLAFERRCAHILSVEDEVAA